MWRATEVANAMAPGRPLLEAAAAAAVVVTTAIAGAAAAPTTAAAAGIRTLGELRQWHPITVDITDGPAASEDGADNPFLDYRLGATFIDVATDRTVSTPCFWAADGDAARTGATTGTVWRCRFTPPTAGEWAYLLDFKAGERVAVTPATAGTPVRPWDGVTGSITVLPTDKQWPDLRAQGKLLVAPGSRYLRWESGEWYLKHGSDSPENFLGYRGFDGSADGRHAYAAHEVDWVEGDPTWGVSANASKGIVGAVNYLASVGVSSIYAMPMTVDGDSKDTWPWTAEREMWRYDVSKLAQWGALFDHMDVKGVVLHCVLSETENEELFERADAGVDNHGFSDARRLFYREMVARFGSKNGLVWNLGEESGWADQTGQFNTDTQRVDFLAHFAALEPYGALLALHTHPAGKEQVFTPLLGDASALTGASLQVKTWADVHAQVGEWVTASAGAGKQWVVTVDEIGGVGALPDAQSPNDHEAERRDVLWGALTAGAGGVEWYYAAGDQRLEDFRGHARLWATTDRLHRFLEAQRVPFWAMAPEDGRVAGAANWALAADDVLLVYLSQGGAAEVTLPPLAGVWTGGWFDPRLGSPPDLLGHVSVTAPEEGGAVKVGEPPRAQNKDWALLLRRSASPEEGTI